MNDALEALARGLGLAEPDKDLLRLRFGAACAERVRHLLEDPEAMACLDRLHDFVAGRADRAALDEAAARAAAIASRHRGSKSIDGAGHAAVSATHAVARALAGRAIDAADYAAYAVVYAAGGSAAVVDRSSFDGEFAWQVQTLRRLAGLATRGSGA